MEGEEYWPSGQFEPGRAAVGRNTNQRFHNKKLRNKTSKRVQILCTQHFALCMFVLNLQPRFLVRYTAENIANAIKFSPVGITNVLGGYKFNLRPPLLHVALLSTLRISVSQ